MCRGSIDPVGIDGDSTPQIDRRFTGSRNRYTFRIGDRDRDICPLKVIIAPSLIRSRGCGIVDGKSVITGSDNSPCLSTACQTWYSW